MSRRIAVSKRAHADLKRLRKFIAKESETSATLAIERLMYGVRLLRDLPELGVRVRPPFRHLILPHGKSGYIVRYRVTKDEVVLVRIWHGKEDRPR
jgi:plasmid stabilization system protein ParE